MCNAEDERDGLERTNSNLHDVIAKLKGAKTETNEAMFPIEEVNKLHHLDTCFNKYAGCVCIKRFADWVITSNPNKDEY
jgi:hypothetical protein